jgi:hypothetical protein
MHVGLQSGKSAVELAAEANGGRGHSEVLEVLCKHGARGALCYAAKNGHGGMVEYLVSDRRRLEDYKNKDSWFRPGEDYKNKFFGHDLEERDQVHFSA